MSKSGIFFIAGCTLAALILLAGMGRWLIERSLLADATAECQQELLKARPAPAPTANQKKDPWEGPWTKYASPGTAPPNSKFIIEDDDVFPTILSCEASDIEAHRKNAFSRFDDLVPKPISDGPNPALYRAQSEVSSRQQKVDRGLSGDFIGSAAMVFLFGLVPLAWYFVLRRLSELAAAIRGDR